MLLYALCALCLLPAGAQDGGAAEPFVVTAPVPYAGKPDLTVMAGHKASVRLAAVSPDGKWLAAAGAGESLVLLWDLTTGRLLRTLDGMPKEVTALTFSADSATVYAGGLDGTILQWAADGALLRTLTRHAERINVLACSPDGHWLASGSDDKTVTLWDADTGAVAQLITEHTAGVSALAFRADSALLASGGLDKRVVLWHLADGAPGLALPEMKHPVAALAFSPAGLALAVANGPNLGGAERRFAASEVTILDAEIGDPVRTLPGIGTGYPAVAYTPDGTQLVTTSSEKTLVCWHAETGHEQLVGVGQLPLPGLQRALTWERDGILKLWDVPQKRLLLSFVGMNNGTAWLRATPQGYYEGSAGADALAAWRFGASVIPCDRYAAGFNKPALVAQALAGGDLSREPVLDGTVLPPNLAIITPKGDQEVKDLLVDVKIQVAGMKPLQKLELTLIGRPVPQELAKTLTATTPDKTTDTFALQLRLPISNTSYRLRAVATDASGLSSAPADVLLYAPGAKPFADKLHVLAVAVGQYRAQGIPALRYAVPDAQAIADVWKNDLGRAFNGVKVQTLVNEQATAAALQAALRNLKDAVGPNDVVVIYLAAHRVRDAGGMPYVAPYDVELTDLRRTALDWRDLTAALNGLRTQRVMVLADIGRAGDTPAARAQDNQRWAFYSARADETAIGRGDWGHGAFAYALLEALRGNADTAQPAGVITISEVTAYVTKRVEELTEGRQHPQWGLLDTRVQNETLTWLMLPDVQSLTLEALTAKLQSGEIDIARRDNVGRTLLHWAAVAQRTEMLDLLLARGADPNAADNAGVTPLHLAASLGAQGVAEKLLAKKADMNVRDQAGRSAFDMARLYDQGPMMDFFLPAAAPDARDETGKTPLHLAVRYGRAGVVQQMLARGNDVNVKDRDGRTPLHLAAIGDQPECAALLLARAASLTATDANGATPLHLAVLENRPRMVQFLIDRAARINAEDNGKRTPMHYAAFADNAAIIDLLAKGGARLNLPDKDGVTPLLMATKEKRVNAVKALLANKAYPNDIDKANLTALHWAAMQDTDEISDLLLTAKANTNAHDVNGNTPLHVAAWYNNAALCEKMIAAGARINEKNAKGQTPLKLAVTNDAKLAIELLKARGGFE